MRSRALASRSASPPGAGTDRSAPRSSRSFCTRRSHAAKARQPRLQQRDADRRVQLVDRAVGLHARMQLGDAAHVAEVRLAAVAELRVDAGQVDGHRAAPSPAFESSHTRTGRRIHPCDRIRSRPHMRIGVPKETAAGEHRVALVPEVVSKLKAKGPRRRRAERRGRRRAAARRRLHARPARRSTWRGDAAEVWGAMWS
jgi:hypothetical protein